MAYEFNFEFSLSHKSMQELVKEIKRYEKELNKAKDYILQALADYTYERVLYYIQESTGHTSYIPTGTLMSSIQKSPIIQNTIKVYTNLAYAKFVEFGTGVTGSKKPHPETSIHGWAYGTAPHKYTNKKTGLEYETEGWYYKGEDGQVHYTKGLEPHLFMYRAREDVKENYLQIAKKALKERGLIK